MFYNELSRCSCKRNMKGNGIKEGYAGHKKFFVLAIMGIEVCYQCYKIAHPDMSLACVDV